MVLGGRLMELIEKKHVLEEIHSQVISWTGNCDSKASIVMALEVVLATFIVSCDYVINTLAAIFTQTIVYFKTGEGVFSLWALLVCLGVIVFCILIGFSMNSLFKTLLGRVDSSTPSLLYWGEIAKLTKEEYSNEIGSLLESDYEIDKINQIHNCSIICQKKFMFYNRALKSAMWSCAALLEIIFTSLLYNCV